MNFFSKLYFSMLVLITLALSVTEYFTVAMSLEANISTQVDTALNNHQLVKYAIQSDIFSSSADSDSRQGLNYTTLRSIGMSVSESMDIPLALYEYPSGALISNSIKLTLPEIDPVENQIEYFTKVTADDRKLIMSGSLISQNDKQYLLITQTDITSGYDNVREMAKNCVWVFLGVTATGILFAIVFSSFITRPIKELTDVGAGFTHGDYSGRVKVRSRDEIGKLASVYNQMADSIEDKISALELAVKQREDFTAAFAHELKTPMTSIIGYADTLYQKDLSETEARAAAGFIVNEGMRLESLSFKLLELMTLRKDDFMLEEIQMSDFMKDIEDTIKPAAARKGIKTIFDYEPGYVRIEIDLFKTLVLNLIDNAMKSGTSDVAVLAQSKDDVYMIAIVDHGRGIPKEELKRVTEAFYMVDKARSRKEHGAGLGLALCERIAQIHKTRLDIRSREGEGTAIRIRLKLEDGNGYDDDEE
ncbi:MAG: HAMP domain-containing histidine kinase [Saccharofermentans sp.]|nr:HAMP domain-containing histidine kinase [Saccharofermentans sp.]